VNSNQNKTSAGRRWLFRLIAVVFVPALILGLVELTLRLTGYGYNTHLFDEIQLDGKPYKVNNESFSLRFFPPELARWPGPMMFEAKKAPGTYRIFIFGESAAQGDPEPAFGAGRYLDVLLRERFPEAKFEVVNVAMTAINSHVILPIARECSGYEGDLWIVYMGNNEMVGPFGAATVFGGKAPPLWTARANLAVQQTKLGQSIKALSGRLKSRKRDASWGAMKMFLGNQIDADSPMKEVVYGNFESNLHDILQAGLDSGAKVLLNTMVVNLKDCPPFISTLSSNLPATTRSQCEQLLTQGAADESEQRFADAIPLYTQAAELNPKWAAIQFRLGSCLLRTGDLQAARTHLQIACDDDMLPFRADSRINAAITNAPLRLASTNLILLDAVAALQSGEPAGICGEEIFYEHVHFNFDGNYRLAMAWARQIEKILPSAIMSHAAAEWASQETCERRLGLTDWNRKQVIDSVIQRLHQPPMSSQSNNAQQLHRLEAQMAELNQHTVPDSAAAAREIYEDALRRRPADFILHENFAYFLEATGALSESSDHWRRAHELMPRNSVANFEEGRVLSRQKKWAEAQTAFHRALELHPRYAQARVELGHIAFAQQDFEGAIGEYDRALELRPNDPLIYCYRAQCSARLGRHSDAIESYRQAIGFQADTWQAHFGLGNELVAANQIAEAKTEYEQVIRLVPTNIVAHLDLGVVMGRLGDREAGLREMREALRLDPNNKVAQEYYERALTNTGGIF
jgi:tetratricopeptide (TPR) repeat protein